MTDADIRARAIALYDRFTHEGGDRRAFMADMARLAGGVAAAELLVAAIAADPAAAQLVAEDDARIVGETLRWTVGDGRAMAGYSAAPRDGAPDPPLVMVIHENRGLTPHIRDVARRLALAGFSALAPDFLAPDGGTPADEDRARTMIGALDLPTTVRDAADTLGWMREQPRGSGRVGAVGFCWGGAMVYRLAVAAGGELAAGVSYYGPAPDPAEAARLHTPLLAQLAGEDARVNATALPFVEAARAAGRDMTAHVYSGVGHAFNNDGSAERYDADAARLAWERTTAFLARHLAPPRAPPPPPRPGRNGR